MAERTNPGYRAYRVRLYPKPHQVQYFRSLFGCCRLVYNHFLAVRVAAYEEHKADPGVRVPSHFDTCRMLTDYKRERTDAEGHAFLKDVDSTALVYELKYLDAAFRRFYLRVREGSSNVGFPRFKRKGDRDSATVTFKKSEAIAAKRVKFAKVGWVPASVWRTMKGTPVSCTVSVDAAGRWWASILFKGVPVCSVPPSDAVAQVSIADVAAMQPDPKLARKVRRAKRSLGRREGPDEGSGPSGRWKAKARELERLLAREGDRAQTQAHQKTTALVREFGTIVVKTPSERKMTAVEREALRQLRYKCEWTGRNLVEEP